MPNNDFEYKSSVFGQTLQKGVASSIDEMQGIVECFVAGIGNRDSVGDIVATGAFTKSLQRRKPRVVWGHNWNDPIGKVLEIYEVPTTDPRLPMKMKMAGIGGLFAKVQFNLQSEKGREAFASVAFFGEEQEWSIGYKTLRAQYDQKSQANVIYELELYEVSPVLHGANQLTGTISVKSDEQYQQDGAVAMMDDEKPNKFEMEKQLGAILGSKVSLLDVGNDEVTFARRGDDGAVKRYKCGWNHSNGRYMFGAPEPVAAPMPRVAIPEPQPMMQMPPNDPRRIVRPQQMPSMPVAVKPGMDGVVVVPLPAVSYDEQTEKPKAKPLDKEEADLRDALLKIVKRHGKFNEDSKGVWAGYTPAAENEISNIGVKCSNCVFYQGEGKCQIIDVKAEDDGRCRFAVIPPGVVGGDAIDKKEYELLSDAEAEEYIEDLEVKYPGEFVLSMLRGAVGKRKKKRVKFKSLSEFDPNQYESGIANESFCIPVHPRDAFMVKQHLDPIFDYYMAETEVDIDGIIIKSGIDLDLVGAIDTALENLKKKFLDDSDTEVKALGRRIGSYFGSRLIDRPNIRNIDTRPGDRRRRGFDINVPTGGIPGFRDPTGSDFDPDRDGWVDEGTTRPRFIGVPDANLPNTERRAPKREERTPTTRRRMASGLNTSRHGYGKDNESRYGISSDEKAKREAFDSLAQSWIDRGNGWVSVPRYNNDNNRSPEFLRGRELGYNQSRHVWTGKGVKKQPAKFNEKAKSSSAYNEWYYDYVRSMSMYLSGIEQLPDKEKKNDSDFYDGIDNAIRADVYSKRPDTNTWGENEKDALSRWLNAYGFSDSSSSKPEKRLSSGKLPGLDEDFDPDNPYGEENVPYDENSMDLYDRIIRDFLGTEPERPKVTKIPAPEKKPEDYTDRDIYEERMAGASLEQMAEKLGTTRVEIRRAEQRHMAEMRRSRTENAAASTEKKLSSGFEAFLNKPENQRTAKERLMYEGPLYKYRDGQILSSGKVEDQEKNDANIQDMYTKMGEAIIASLQEIIDNPEKRGKWDLPWRTPEFYGRNPTRKNRIYQGMNQLMLSHAASKRDYKTNRWAGITQWRELKKGVKLKKGEVGVNILVPYDMRDSNGVYIGKGFKIETVYNADQMEGLPDWVYKVDEVAQLSDAERLADIENVVKEIGPKYREQGFRAFYSPADDTITIPPFAAFKDPTAFYATMLHEIIHWTGSPGRLNRDKSGNRFGNEGYAFEELIAEIGSSFAMGFLGLEPEIRDDHIQYLASWLQVLKNDPGQIRKALEQSQQAVDYIMNKSATLRRRAGVPDNERKGKEDYTIEVPIIGKITIPIIKPKRPKEGDVPVEQPKPKARIRVRGSGPGAVKTILEDYENNRLSSGISGFVIKDEEGNYYNQINQRLSSGRGPIVGAKDPNRKIERTEGSFMEKFGMKFEPTDEQKDVMDAVAHLTNNEEGGLVAVRAGAGTGKTTTVEQSVIRMAKESPKSKYYYITFNRKNAAEAQRRMPDNTGSSSINQLAYWSLLLEDRDAITPEYKEKLRKIGVGPGDEFYAAANPKSKRKTEAVGFGGKTVDTTGKKKVGFRTLGYVSFETQSGGKDVSKHYDLKKLYPEGITHENVKLDDVDFGLVLINALTRYSQSEDDVLSEKHFKLRPHEIKRNAQGGVDPAETDFKEIPKEWVDFATKMWADIMDPESNVLPNFDQQVKIWALQRPNLRTDAGMVGHGTRKVKDARSQDKNLEVGSIVQIDGEDFVYTGGGRGALRRRYATEENPLNVFFFDEAQDVNPVLLKVIEDNIRDNNLATVMVGDPRQSIYGFRGSTDSFAKLDPDFNLTLTDSFRYGKTTAFIGNLILGRGNAADRENGVPDVAANYQLFGRLQDVVRADFNLGTLSGAQLAKKLDSIEKKYGITGPNGQKLADMPEKERNDLLTKVVSYLAPEREGILYRQIPADADGTWAFISYSNRNTLEEALQFLSQHQDKTIGLPAEKYKDMVEFLRHLLWVKRPTGTRPRESKIIGNVWDAAEINKRASQKSSYGQLASMMKLLRVRDANGNQLSEIDWLNRLLGRKDPKTGEILERARIRPLEEPIDVDPFKNIDGTSSIVSGAELKMLGALKAGKGGGGKVGGYKLNRDKRFNIVPNPSGQSPSREIFWKLDTEGLKDGESWENGVIISGEGIIDSYEFKDAAGKIQRTGDKNGEKPIARRRLETFINDLGLGDKITIAPKYVPRKAGSSNAPSYDAIRIKGSTPDETGTLLSLVGKFITDTTNDPEVDASFLTTHAAKGLEFDNVILGNDFFQPEFDNAGNVVTDIDREMENLIYVAATRAKRRIQMSDATAWIIDRKKNKRGFEFVEKNLSAEQQAPSGFWNPFDESAEQVYPDGARELASGRALSVSAPAKATRKLGNAPEGRGTNRQERRQRLRSGATPNTDGFAFLDEDTMKQDLQKFATGNFNNRPVDRHIGPDYKRFTPDPIELEERRKHEALIERWGKEGLGWQTAGWTQADKYKSPDYLRGRELGINQARVKWLGDAQERPRDFNEKQKASATYRSWFYSYVRQLGTYLDANRREDDKYWEGVEDGARQSIATHMPMTDTWMREDVDNMVDWMRQYGFGPSGEKIKKETVKPQRLLSSGAVRARPTASGMPAKRERRMASGAVYSQNVSATNLAAIRGSKSGSDYEFARRFWDGFRKRGITLDTSSKAPSAQERRRQINAGLDKVSGAMRNRPEIKIGSVSQNARLDNPDSTTWMLPVSKLRESIRIPTEFDVARNPDNTVRDVNWTKSEPISISDLAKIMNLSPQDKKKLTSDDAGISHDSVRYLIAELGNQPEFAGWRLFSPVTDDEPGNARMSQAQRFAENLGRANMRDRFIIEAFGKDAYPFWYDGSEKEIIDADEYSSLGEVDPAAKFNAVGRFSRNPDDASGEAMAESDLIYEGMPDVSTRRAEEIAKTEEAPQITDKTSRKDFELKKLLDHLGLSEDERGMQELNTRLQKAFGVQDSDLFNPRQASSWRSGGVPTAYIKEMIRTGMIPDAKTVWNDNNVGQKLDDELLSSRNNVFEAAIEFLGKTQGMSAGNTKQNKEYILGAKNLAMVLPQAARTKGKSFSKKKGDEPRFSRQELQGIVNRFNEIFNTNHTIDDIFSREQLETARKRLEEEGRTVFGRSSKD